ncbi:MAG: replication restart helicase PriA [Erysipelotrichaceae bacterium]
MIIAEILTQHATMGLNRTFTYDVDGFAVSIGSRVEINFGGKDLIGIVLSLTESSQSFDYVVKKINRVMEAEVFLSEELLALGRFMAQAYITPLMGCYQAMLPPALKNFKNKDKRVLRDVVEFVKTEPMKTAKQDLALAYVKQVGSVDKAEFIRLYKSVAKAIIATDCVVVVARERKARLEAVAAYEKQTLTKAQQAAFDQIIANKDIYLLHGVTGSGKTEVFLHLAQHYLDKDEQVLILVPEISLTKQMIDRVKGRFGKRVAIYHSHLSAQEKYEQYRLVQDGEVDIVVGTRSAIFMPFHTLGLIVMDEEHDTSYKQDRNPKYHALDIAKQRASYHGANLVLASATPSLESYARALKKVYQLVELKERINQSMPSVELVDMMQEVRRGGNAHLSQALLEAMGAALERKEQIILLLNRRGFASQRRCMQCGDVRACPHCEVPLTYHKADQHLHCHYCGYEESPQYHCPVCRATSYALLGMGTQRLVEEVQAHFSEAKILRMDYDTTRLKNSHTAILQDFEAHKADILVGTQMIAKGLDFENVTLVGIVNADDALMSPSYLSTFRTFSLLVQASGRSGRSEKQGRVILQAYNPDHYALVDALAANYLDFFQKEMRFRHLAQYPPYVYMSSISVSGIHEQQVSAYAHTLKQLVSAEQAVHVIGPSVLQKRNDLYRVRLMVKAKQEQHLQVLGAKVMEYHLANKSRLQVSIDLHPQDLES